MVFGLTRPGLDPTIYRTQSEQANHYATDAVRYNWNIIESGIKHHNHNPSISPQYEGYIPSFLARYLCIAPLWGNILPSTVNTGSAFCGISEKK
jgi:hypothetical protein